MADLRPQYTEEAVGHGHPTKSDVINRAYNVEHDIDGTHGAITPTSVTTGAVSGTTGVFTGIITATGGQIAFPATAVPSADPNTVDDYEEGTWTAILTCGTSGTITLNSSYDLMSYTRIGRKVTLCGNVVVASVSSPVGVLTMSMPFANHTGTDESGMTAAALFCQGLEATGTTAMQGNINNGSSFITIAHFTAGAMGAAAADIKASSQIAINVSYFVA